MFPSRFAYVLNSYLNCNALRKPPLEHFDLLLLCYGLADRARNSEPAKEWAVTRHEVDKTVLELRFSIFYCEHRSAVLFQHS